MEIIGCEKGHYYNPKLYDSCPECAKEAGNSTILGSNDPGNYNDYARRFSDPNKTIGIDSEFSFGDDYIGGGSNDVGQTEPVSNVPKNIIGTEFFGVQDYGGTQCVDPLDFRPVVGWLVCIDGAAKGRDYRIHSQYNYIGRGHHMDICINGDNCISTERAAVIAYDEKEKCFFFGPGTGHNLVRVNGTMLMNAVPLNAYDELTIGKTTLLFVPLCGERFDWNDK